jgi:DNA-binding transcriptional LysR family regulator
MQVFETDEPSAAGDDRASFDAGGLSRGGLKLSHMRMIVALADLGQVSAAAQVLSMSQPAASRMIAEMEATLKAPLLVRMARGVALTPYGEALVRRARAILQEFREAGREIADLRSGQGGSVVIGAVTAPAIELAVPAIQRLREANPRLDVAIQVDTSPVLVRELLASRCDLILARIPDDLNPRLFESQEIGVEKLCLVVRQGHPLADGRPITLEQVSGHEWVLQPSGSLLRRTIERMFVARGVSLPERVISTGSLLLTLVLLSQSDAISAVSMEVANFLRSQEGLGSSVAVLPTHFSIEVQPYSLIHVRNRMLSPAATAVWSAIRDVIAERAP